MRSKHCVRASIALLSAGLIGNADTLILRNGSRVDGSYLGGDNRTLRFAVYDHVNTYNLTEIDTLRLTGGNQSGTSAAPAAPTYQPSAPPPPAPPVSDRSAQTQAPYPSSPQAPYPQSPAPAASRSSGPETNWSNNNAPQIPAGIELTVRLIDPVDSETDRLGQTYRASLDQPVVVNGQTVIPRGADAVATLIDAQKSGKIQGRTSLTLDLKTLSFNGRQYDITTTGVSQESGSRGARSAKVIGGTAAVGAIIGALAGGGKGAAIGAGSGAAVGTAAQVITSGQKVKVPAETRLSFTLQNPVNL